MKKKWVNVFVCCIIAICANAQTEGYNYFSNLDTVKSSGFYNIALTPEINAHLKTDYSDIRVVNDSVKWVPHVYRTPETETGVTPLSLKMDVVRKENSLSSTSFIVKSNDSAISYIHINIRNTEAERFCTVSGSDDLKNWFTINDSILLKPQPGDDKYQSFFQLSFPAVTYRYFKLLINNKGKEPLNLIDVYSGSPTPWVRKPNIPEYLPIKNPEVVIAQKDSGTLSYIKVTQSANYHFNSISLRLEGARYFYRTIDMYSPADCNHSFAHPGALVGSFIISNNSTLQFRVPVLVLNSKTFYLLIHNDDNPPLKVADVKTYCKFQMITAYLEAGQHYRLFLDNPSATPPKYDLGKFHTEFENYGPFRQAIFLQAGKIETTEKKAKGKHSTSTNNKWMLWMTITIAIIILLFFTQKMVREVEKRKQDDNL